MTSCSSSSPSSSHMLLSFSSSIALTRGDQNSLFPRRNHRVGFRQSRSTTVMADSKLSASPGSSSSKLVTFLGKGGSGKTIASVLAAQYYAKMGTRTCLVIQSQDPTVEFLLGCRIGSSPISCGDNLSAVRLETTKMLLEPLSRIKKADARLNLTQGVLDGVVGEELGVLPGMDSVLSLGALEKWSGLLGEHLNGSNKAREYDVIVYDGLSSEDTLRMVGATEKARWYLNHFQSLAEKTDIGRLVTPSLLRLANESVNLNGTSTLDVTSSEIWDTADRILEKSSSAFLEPSKFSCFIVIDPNNPMSVNCALRYWGCAIQAGTQVSGAFGFNTESSITGNSTMKEKLAPLAFESIPYISTNSPVHWQSALNGLSDGAKQLLCGTSRSIQSSVVFDRANKTVTLFLPGFDKSEIKLYQYRGGLELLVEAGDQRRVICLPRGIQGKVRGAKFTDRHLIVKLM